LIEKKERDDLRRTDRSSGEKKKKLAQREKGKGEKSRSKGGEKKTPGVDLRPYLRRR